MDRCLIATSYGQQMNKTPFLGFVDPPEAATKVAQALKSRNVVIFHIFEPPEAATKVAQALKSINVVIFQIFEPPEAATKVA